MHQQAFGLVNNTQILAQANSCTQCSLVMTVNVRPIKRLLIANCIHVKVNLQYKLLIHLTSLYISNAKYNQLK